MFFKKKYLKRIQELEYENHNLKRRIRQDESVINKMSSYHEVLLEKKYEWEKLADLISSIPIVNGDPISIPDRGIKIIKEYLKIKQ